MKQTFILFLIIFSAYSCKTKNCVCAKLFSYDNRISYSNPVSHPNQEIIGFNHIPLETINHYYYDKDCDCPPDIYFNFKEDSIGFWIAKSNGSNMHRVLPYQLANPTWSSDGKQIAYTDMGVIKLMPFDGEKFDTTAINTIQFKDQVFNITWNTNGRKLVFQNKGSNDSLKTGVWQYNFDTQKVEFIYPNGKFPSWMPGSDEVVFIVSSAKYDSILSVNTTSGIKKLITLQNRISTVNRYNIKSSPDGQTIGFISYNNSDYSEQLYTMNADGSNLNKLLSNYCYDFNWTIDCKIMYVNSETDWIDKIKSTLWIMDKNGGNKQQLTYNYPEIIKHYVK